MARVVLTRSHLSAGRLVLVGLIVMSAILATSGAGVADAQQRGGNVVPAGFEYLLDYETQDLATLVTEEGEMLLRSQGVADATALSRNQLLQLAVSLETSKLHMAKDGGAGGVGGVSAASVEVLYCVG